MTARRAFLVAFSLFVVGLVWFLWPRHGGDDPVPSTAATPSASPQSAIANRPSAIPPLPLPAEVSELAKNLNSPATDIRADLRIVLEIVETFRTNFPRDGNPAGSNAEITAALTGQNKLRLALIPPGHPAINREGELCDRWGTPFFFHSESATRMEVRSAGPDKKMWTDDDVVQTP
jgi:hypothetical protein